MKLKIMIGFWFQPASAALDEVLEAVPELTTQRDAIEAFLKGFGIIEDDSQLFHAVLGVDDNGVICDAVIIDKLGRAVLTEGRLVGNHLTFRKEYDHRDDAIYYSLDLTSEGFYDGGFDGEATGRGRARCYIFDPDPRFFNIPTQGV